MNVIRPAGAATIAAETALGWIKPLTLATQIFGTIKNTSDIALGKIARQQRDADLLEACKVAVSSIHPGTGQMMGGVKLELYSDADETESDNYALPMPRDWWKVSVVNRGEFEQFIMAAQGRMGPAGMNMALCVESFEI